uniref:Uncharacterized protein n=1 Tax=Oryza sativa subsp. indica TaxID=39946 RepID=A0A679BC42_ORYSI|nr:hypothetical protein [Oryza sativa Indica Group]
MDRRHRGGTPEARTCRAAMGACGRPGLSRCRCTGCRAELWADVPPLLPAAARRRARSVHGVGYAKKRESLAAAFRACRAPAPARQRRGSGGAGG